MISLLMIIPAVIALGLMVSAGEFYVPVNKK